MADPIPEFEPANDEVVAHIVIYASSWVETRYTDGLSTPEGLSWLKRRIAEAAGAVGSPECVVRG